LPILNGSQWPTFSMLPLLLASTLTCEHLYRRMNWHPHLTSSRGVAIWPNYKRSKQLQTIDFASISNLTSSWSQSQRHFGKHLGPAMEMFTVASNAKLLNVCSHGYYANFLVRKVAQVRMVCEVAVLLSIFLSRRSLTRKLVSMQATVRQGFQQGTYPKQLYATFNNVAFENVNCLVQHDWHPASVAKLCHFLTGRAYHVEVIFNCEQNLSFKPHMWALLRPQACGTAKSRWRVTEKFNPRTRRHLSILQTSAIYNTLELFPNSVRIERICICLHKHQADVQISIVYILDI
jgi:uncharacterized protein (UPF0548 family)